MGVLEMAVCFVSASFGVSHSISVNGLHANKSVVGPLLVKCSGRPSNGPVVCVEGDILLFVRLIGVVIFVPSFEFLLR